MLQRTKLALRHLISLLLPVLMLSFWLFGCGTPGNNQSGVGGNAPGNNPATILSIVGDTVFIQQPGNTEWLKAEEGMSLEVNCRVRTGETSRAAITLFDGSVIELEDDTAIGFAELDRNGAITSIRITQEIGRTLSKVVKLADPASQYEIETIAAVAAVRGTVMFVAVAADGSTVVGNIEGAVSVTAQGVEVKLAPNTYSQITPGAAPGQPAPGPSPATGQTPAVPTQTPTATPVNIRISFSVNADKTEAFLGDDITYTYNVTNTGSAALSGVSVADDRVGTPSLEGGDTNSNNSLDTGETWVFGAAYTIKAGDTGQIQNSATATAIGPNNQKVTATANSSVKVSPISVTIDNVQQADRNSNSVTLQGSVNDPSIDTAVLTLNGGSTQTIPVSGGKFQVAVVLPYGPNTIKITVSKPGGITAYFEFELVPVVP